MPADEPAVSEKAELPAVGAVEWLADAGAQESEGKEKGKEGEEKAREAAAVSSSLTLSGAPQNSP